MRTPTATDVRSWARDHVDDLAAVGLYAVVRAILLGPVGLRMDLRFLTFAPHLPDLGLLQDRLAETLWYTHTQPPLYAGFVGLLLKLSPFPDGATFLVAHLAMGATLAVLLRRLGDALGLGRPATFAALACAAGFPVTLLSPDDETLAAGLAAGCETRHLVSKRFPEDLAPDRRTAVVLFFHDHEWEPPILAAALDSPAFYIGAQGSRRARDTREAGLEALGVVAGSYARMKGPIGLVPSARDARTLAVSVLAEVLSETHANPA